jgi:hypothetical protein
MNNPKDTLEKQPVLNSDNEELAKEEVSTITDDEKQVSSDAPEEEITDEEKLKQLLEFRKNGNVSLDITYSSFKTIRNLFKNKISWKGPNQAYLLCVLMMNLEQALAGMDVKSTEPQKVALRNDSIEAISVFMNQIEGNNSMSAQNNLSMFLTIQQAIGQLQSIDNQITSLEEKLKV